MIASIDETAPEDSSGIYYVVGATVLISEPGQARSLLKAVIDEKGRKRPFHWSREGTDTRNKMMECLGEIGAVSHICVHYPTGRRKQEEARARGLAALIPHLIGDGVEELLIESRGDQLVDDRDKRVILSTLEGMSERGAFSYSWHTKGEELLWPADAVCGAVREFLLGENSDYYDHLHTMGVITDLMYLSSPAGP